MSIPNLLLRLEELPLFVVAIASYWALGGNGWLFIILLLVPDVAMLAYGINKQVGSIVYNVAHFYGLPLAVIALGLLTNTPLATQIGIIWFAHISMDRMVGYGLKYETNFKDTHLQRI